MEGRDLEDFDLGPEEHQLILDEVELNSEQQRKIKQLQSENFELQAEVESLTRRVRVFFAYSPQSNISDLYSPVF